MFESNVLVSCVCFQIYFLMLAVVKAQSKTQSNSDPSDVLAGARVGCEV